MTPVILSKAKDLRMRRPSPLRFFAVYATQNDGSSYTAKC
jgi:hypothetical protein